MTSFVNPSYPKEHRGAARLETAVTALGQIGSQFKGAKGLVAVLLAGAISAMVVIADQIVSTWTDGHLLMAWVTLWAFVFAALALFAEVSRGWTAQLVRAFQAHLHAAQERANDERIWALAQSDPRLMADLQSARLRAERDAQAVGEPLPSWPFAELPTHRIIVRPWS
jgi:hypothetical protein